MIIYRFKIYILMVSWYVDCMFQTKEALFSDQYGQISCMRNVNELLL